MRTSLFNAMAILSVALGLAACSSDDNLSDGGQSGKLEGAQYMNVSVITGSSTPNGAKAATRAGEGYIPGGTGNDLGTFNNGSNNEGHLSDVRFYFFDGDGNAVSMDPYANQTVNNPNEQYTATSLSSASNYVQANFEADDYGKGRDESLTIERRYASLVFNPVNGIVPAQTVAIANFGSLTTTPAELNTSNLNNLAQGTSLATTTSFYNGDKTNFAMSSSVFADANGKPEYSSLTSGKIGSDVATLSPVDVYVERIAAKVLAAKGNSANWVKVNKGTDGNYTISSDQTGQDAYVLYDGTTRENNNLVDAGGTHSYRVLAVIEGWGLADEQTSAYIFKNIQSRETEKWSENLGFTFSNPAFHRCYWETTPTNVNPKDYSWNNYTTGDDAFKNLNPTNIETAASEGNSGYTPQAKYTFPNTPTLSTYKTAVGITDEKTPADADMEINANKYWNEGKGQTNLTKLLVAATLVYSDDNGTTYKPATICRYGGVNYLSEDLMKSAIANRNNIIVGVRNAAVGETPAGEITWHRLDSKYLKVEDQNKDNKSTSDTQFKEISVIDEDAIKNALKVPDNQEIVFAQGTINNENQVTISNAWYNTDSNRGLTSANKQLEDQTFIIWNGGKTYYYTTIRHLATTGGSLGSYGVVRNHEYRLTVNSFAGFGTAVYNPEHTIVPVIPEDRNTYMSARVNVLSWRVVNQGVEFNATEK